MTIEFRPPRPGEEGQLRALFTEAFHDAWFTELFFDRGYSPDRCFLAAETEVLAGLHWFDCTLRGRKLAYLYGIATFEAQRGKGIGSRLIQAALKHLEQDYDAALLVRLAPLCPCGSSAFSNTQHFAEAISPRTASSRRGPPWSCWRATRTFTPRKTPSAPSAEGWSGSCWATSGTQPGSWVPWEFPRPSSGLPAVESPSPWASVLRH